MTRPDRRRDSAALNSNAEVDVRILRAADLLDLRLTAPGCVLQAPGDGEDVPILVAEAEDAQLVLHLPPQHIDEAALFEETGNEGDPPPDPSKVPSPPANPVAHRSAAPSRLVFAIPNGTRLPFTLESLLTILPTLQLRVAAQAMPAPEPEQLPPPGGGLAPAGPSGGDVPAASVAEHVSALRLLAGHLAQDAGTVPSPVGDELGLRMQAADGRRRSPIRSAFGGEPPHPPDDVETAIEAPYRLTVSPSPLGSFWHPTAPVAASNDARRVELWRTHLTVRRTDETGAYTGHDDLDQRQRIVRAIWSRDMDPLDAEYVHGPASLQPEALAPVDRRAIVRLTSDATLPGERAPLQVRSLALSALGAWLDWSGEWQTDGLPHDSDFVRWMDSYRHRAVLGRDAYVRVAVPGFLFPFGHRAVWVTVSERKVRLRENGVAYLWRRQFIVVRQPTRMYAGVDTTAGRAMPFGRISVEPLTTPNLDAVPAGLLDPVSAGLNEPILPTRGGVPYEFTLVCVDRAGEVVTLAAPLVFVEAGLGVAAQGPAATLYAHHDHIDARGQTVFLAPPHAPGDTALQTHHLAFTGTVTGDGRSSEPALDTALAVVPAMKHLAPSAPVVSLTYAKPFLDHGFDAGGNPGSMFLALTGDPAPVDFSSGSERGGGFLSPSLPVRGLSRALGAVGEDGATPGAGLNAGTFDPTSFLAGALPKLFGLIKLTDILNAAGLGEAPRFVTEALDAVASIDAGAKQLQAAVDQGRARLAAEVTGAAHDGAKQAAQAALTALESKAGPAVDAVTALQAAVTALTTTADADAAIAALNAVVDPLGKLLDALASPAMPAAVRAQIERPARALRALPSAETNAALEAVLKNLLSPPTSVTARFDWTPGIHAWPLDPDPAKHLFHPADPKNLRLAVEVRAAAQGPPAVDVAAELIDFELRLLPGEPLMALKFRRIGFRAASGAKPEVDVVFGGIEFLGILTFIETLRRMIPFDGFADPPFVDVAPDGVTAGFDLALPNVSIGVFSLENIALAADARLPFLGDATTVGFAFCSKESPFRLTVMMVGGGGWVALRASPKGLVLLEVGLEAAASLSVDLGVASGSVSVAVGVYLRLEGDKGSLTAYFRIRGEVDVLGIVSASITLELSLRYDFPTGKLVGRASLVVDIEVLFFSASVEITVERRLAGSGSASDPTLMDVLPPGAGGDEDWALYCEAFAPPTVA
ncbi:MAG: hypothetical protein JWM31_361 [Solirubrobacterales bacterium]|nr:hypothetical protein [Solirubrobacterales bacterium]